MTLSDGQQEGDWFAIALTAQVNLGAKATFAIPQGFRCCLTAPRPSGVLMRSNDAAIDEMQLSVKLPSRISLLVQAL